MDYWSELLEGMAGGLLYGLVGIALLVVGFVVIDLLTPGKLGRLLSEDRNRNAGIIVASGLLAIGIIVTSAILASEGSLLEGLGQSAGYGLVGIVLLGVAFTVIDVITPGKLGDIVTASGHEPMVYVTAASLLSVGGIVAAAIS